MKTLIVGLLIFSVFFSIGLLLARHKPLWDDELWEQQMSVQDTSWLKIISGHTVDWNNFPLYHALQKAFMQMIHWKLPFALDGTWFVVHPQAQLVMRLLPDFLVSIAMTAIVLFFGFRSGFVPGLATLLICLSMPMVWVYWVEARSYSLWFMLTVFQSLLFLDTAARKESQAPRGLFLLTFCGLCLTAPLGILQTIVCQGLLWCAGIKGRKFYLVTGAVPLFLGAYYFILRDKMGMFPGVPWPSLFFDNFPMEELVFLSGYVIFLLLLRASLPSVSLGCAFLPFCFVFIVISFIGIFYVVSKSVPHAAPVVSRHFIFLTPVSIIMTAAIFSDLWQAAAKRFWWSSGVLIIFASGLLSQALSVFISVNRLGVYF
ncbi:MAG: hypothetical protein HQL14_08030 [Candidatus Omnitrophica bacterium]|nr:hypothetical protein [Candidatus Omnitrophota bacterium]